MTINPPQFTVYVNFTGQDHFADPPARRLGALGILRDEKGRVLFCEKTPRDLGHSPWYLPGGCVERNEQVPAALVRTVRAKLGIEVTPGRLLAVHHMQEAKQTERGAGNAYLSREGVNLVIDCGTVSVDTPMTFGANVIGARWFHPDELREHLTPFTADRTEAALRALAGDEVELLSGNPLQ